MYDKNDLQSLRSWIAGHGDFQAFLDMLVDLAADNAEFCKTFSGSADKQSTLSRMQLRQWERVQRKLKELADWSREVGPGSGCR